LLGWFFSTKKNAPAKEFYAEHGFELQSQNAEGALWTLDLAQRPIASPPWIKLEGVTGEPI
jgi:predicted enzyme involved in methoxymalonyl-ACP biosynthesis